MPGVEKLQDSLGLAFCFAFGEALVVDSLNEGLLILARGHHRHDLGGL
jgi:hypothetical protein